MKFRLVSLLLLCLILATGCVKPDDKAIARRHFNDGFEAGKAGRYEDAVQAFNLAIMRDEELALAFMYRSDAYYRLAKYDVALEDVNHFLNFDAQNEQAYNLRGIIYE
jgi:tetratricopeptide (TPR) repeat protein